MLKRKGERHEFINFNFIIWANCDPWSNLMLHTRNLHHHATLRLKVDGLSITAYKSGKVSLPRKGHWRLHPKEPPRTIDDVTTKKAQDSSRRFCDLGVIEAMKSERCLLCPLTVAAAYVSKENIATLKAMGVAIQKYDGRPNQRPPSQNQRSCAL